MLLFRKSLVLLSCTMMGLICGTLYVYSSYSPQLAQRLGYSATNASLAALSGNFAVAISGPFAGIIVDKKGYTLPLAIGVLALLIGYIGLRAQYITMQSAVTVLCFCLFMVGLGLTFIFLACLKCCAVSFPKQRGVATSFPSAMYGLLAMFYSVVASSYYPGDTQGFLFFLPLSIVIIFVACAPAILMCESRRAPPLKVVLVTDSIELKTVSSRPSAQMGAYDSSERSDPPLLYSPRFWLLFIITGALAAVGQMYIYSVGYMVKALVVAQFLLGEDPTLAEAADGYIQVEQQAQVALLSIANCTGRLVAGFLGDFVRHRLRKPRSWLLFAPSIGFTVTLFLAKNLVDCHGLRAVSMLCGFMYGFTFCILPIIVGDVFGMDNFSRNWGFLGLAPLLPSNFFTSLFGVVYDSRSVTTSEGLHLCLLGKGCYEQVFGLSLMVSIMALIIVFVFNFGDDFFSDSPVTGGTP